MRTCCKAQQALLSALWLTWKGKEIQKGEDICICMAEPLFCVAKSNTEL